MATSIIWGRDSGADIKLPFAGNSALLGTRIINAGASDDVALAFNEFVPDASTIALYHLNETAYPNGATVVDSAGTHDLSVYTGAGHIDSVEGWLGRAAFKPATDQENVAQFRAESCPDEYLPGPTGTVEAWVWPYSSGSGSGWVGTIWTINARSSAVPKVQFAWGFWTNYKNRCVFRVYDPDGTQFRAAATSSLPYEQWHHIAAVWEADTVRLYHDGQLAGTANAPFPLFDGWTWDTRRVRMFTAVDTHDDEQFRGIIDELRYSSVARYTSDFSPHRFEPGTVTLQYNIAAAPLKAVDWSLSTSLADGRVTKIEAYNPSTQQWETLAEDSNGLQPPIYVSGVYVQGPDLIRLTLVPKNDALQSETPVLDWVRVILGEDITVINNNEIIWGRDGGISGGISLKWSGNSTGENVRIVNENEAEDDVALAFNEYEPDEYTVGLWHMNEETWTGAEGEVIDSSGNGHHGKAIGPPTNVEAWLDRGGYFQQGRPDRISIPPHSDFDLSTLTWEGWFRYKHADINARLFILHSSDNTPFLSVICQSTELLAVRITDSEGAQWSPDLATNPLIDEMWHHVALCADSTGNYAALWIDGRLIDDAEPGFTGDFSGFDYLYIASSNSFDKWNGWADEIRISNITRYTSDFSPHRFEPGAITAQYALPSQYRLTAIDWDGLLGASYGLVTKVEVYSSGWKTVAEDSNGITPPLTGLSYTVAGPNIVRLTLVPKGDTLQSETPVLDWLKIAIEPLHTLVPPFWAADVQAPSYGATDIHDPVGWHADSIERVQ